MCTVVSNYKNVGRTIRSAAKMRGFDPGVVMAKFPSGGHVWMEGLMEFSCNSFVRCCGSAIKITGSVCTGKEQWLLLIMFLVKFRMTWKCIRASYLRMIS